MPPEILERIHLLWDELADLDAASADTAADRLMVALCDMVGAQNASWFGSMRLGDTFPEDPVKGWRASTVRFLHPTQPLDEAAREQVKNLEQGVAGETTVANVAGAGRFRANRLRDLVAESWFDSPYYHCYFRGVGHCDAIYVASPVNEDAESWFGIYRACGQPAFTSAERDMLAYALRGIKWFHRRLMLSHGLLVASAPLSPAERRVLHLLLTGMTEKEIAAHLNLATSTAHQYISKLYRKFNARSRAALMSLWLGRAG